MVKLSPPRPVKAKVTFPVRVAGADYQNTTGRPLLVIVTIDCVRASVVGGYAYGNGYIGTAPSPANSVSRDGLYTLDNTAESTVGTLIFAVPNDYYYMVLLLSDGLGSTITIHEWTEVEL